MQGRFVFLKDVMYYHHWSFLFLLCTRTLLFLRSYTLLPTPRPFPSSSHQTKAIITPHLFFSISFSFLLLFLYTRALSFYIFARTCAPAPFSSTHSNPYPIPYPPLPATTRRRRESAPAPFFFYTLLNTTSVPLLPLFSAHYDDEEGEYPSSLFFLHIPNTNLYPSCLLTPLLGPLLRRGRVIHTGVHEVLPCDVTTYTYHMKRKRKRRCLSQLTYVM